MAINNIGTIEAPEDSQTRIKGIIEYA